MNKKAQVWAILSIIVFLLVLAIILLITGYVGTELTEKIGGSSINSTTEAAHALDMANTGINLLDTFFFIVFFAFIVGIIVTSFYQDVHPVFLIMFIIFLIIAIIVSIPVSNAYDKIYNTGTLNVTAAKFDMTYNIMSNLPLFTLVIGIIGIVVLYSKTRSQSLRGGI